MDLNYLLTSRREEILSIAAKHGARNVRIFGSVARGEAGEESDIDLLVDVGPGRTPFFPGGCWPILKSSWAARLMLQLRRGCTGTLRTGC